MLLTRFAIPNTMKKMNCGFTLIELMITLAVAAIVLLVAVPSFDNLMEKNRVEAAQKDLARDIAFARQAAATRNTFVSICKSSDGASCGGNWKQGWITYVDVPGGTAGVVDGDDDVLRVHAAINSSDSLTSVDDFLQFSASGALQEPDASLPEFKICSASGDHVQGLTVLRSGRAIVKNSLSCP